MNLEQMEICQGGCSEAEQWGAWAAVVVVSGMIGAATCGVAGWAVGAAGSAMINAGC